MALRRTSLLHFHFWYPLLVLLHTIHSAAPDLSSIELIGRKQLDGCSFLFDITNSVLRDKLRQSQGPSNLDKDNQKHTMILTMTDHNHHTSVLLIFQYHAISISLILGFVPWQWRLMIGCIESIGSAAVYEDFIILNGLVPRFVHCMYTIQYTSI